jgi:ubiquinone/menaquinone biosynthesis C-methylase UbiE
MNDPEIRHAAEISEFYRHIRGYWGHLSASQDGQGSGMLNFGYWKDGCTDLYLAQQHLLDKVRTTLDHRDCVEEGLEIGCGIGGISIGLLAAMPALRMAAIDISSGQLAVARQNADAAGVVSRLDFREDDAMALSFAAGRFDFSLCIESSFHYGDKATFFAENFRVLKPGGRAVLADITCEDVERVAFRRGNHFESWRRYVALAEETGFAVESVEDIGPLVYEPLYRHILQFNKQNRELNGKYWSVVLRNYARLAGAGLMGYHFFRFRKPV